MADNEYVNRVDYGNDTIIDISDTTAEAGDVIQGQTFYTRSGAPATGTLGNATQSTHGLMSAADKTKLDAMNGTSVQEIDVAIATTDWTSGAPYTYNWLNSAVSTSCYIDVDFKTNARGIFNGDISYDKITGGIQFIATEKPIDTINLVVQIIERQGTIVQNNSSSGLTTTIKNALLNCFANVAWTTNSGQTYYNALQDALFGIASINATLNLNGTLIRENDSLNDLKQYLTVTVLQNDGNTVTLTSSDYTLNGTIGLNSDEYDMSTQTITITYAGKTSTISVPVYNKMVLDKITLPSGYTQLTMIQSNGNGNTGPYIDTGVNGLSIDHVKYGIQLTSDISNGANRHVLSSNVIFYPYFRRGNSGSQKFQGMYKRRDGTSTELNTEWAPNVSYVIEAYPTVKINGETIATLTAGDATTDMTMLLCCRNSGSGEAMFRAPLRYFFLKFFDDQNNVTHNYVPCKNSQNVVGMYETVNGVFYPSTDENYSFTAGEAIL